MEKVWKMKYITLKVAYNYLKWALIDFSPSSLLTLLPQKKKKRKKKEHNITESTEWIFYISFSIWFLNLIASFLSQKTYCHSFVCMFINFFTFNNFWWSAPKLFLKLCSMIGCNKSIKNPFSTISQKNTLLD